MVSKIIVILCVIWIGFCVFVLTIGQQLSYEFTIKKNEELFYGIIWLSLPLAIILILLRKRNQEKSNATIFVFAFISFIIAGFFVLDKKICGYNEELVYINKYNPEEKIIKRFKGCGAHDSDIPEIHFFKIKPFNNYFVNSVSVDISILDTNIWQNVSYQKSPKTD